MQNKSQTFAGIGGLIGGVVAGINAVKQYNFADANGLGQGVGYIVGGMLFGAIVGYFLGKLF